MEKKIWIVPIIVLCVMSYSCGFQEPLYIISLYNKIRQNYENGYVATCNATLLTTLVF